MISFYREVEMKSPVVVEMRNQSTIISKVTLLCMYIIISV